MRSFLLLSPSESHEPSNVRKDTQFASASARTPLLRVFVAGFSLRAVCGALAPADSARQRPEPEIALGLAAPTRSQSDLKFDSGMF
jgi:hypothetical protein